MKQVGGLFSPLLLIGIFIGIPVAILMGISTLIGNAIEDANRESHIDQCMVTMDESYCIWEYEHRESK